MPEIKEKVIAALREGNGNIVYDSNPVLLSNLFLEYRIIPKKLTHKLPKDSHGYAKFRAAQTKVP